LLKRGTRRIVIGIHIRKCFEKLLQIFFFRLGLFGKAGNCSTPGGGRSDNSIWCGIFPSIDCPCCFWMVVGHFVLNRFHVKYSSLQFEIDRQLGHIW
jgi:hypothetical protein